MENYLKSSLQQKKSWADHGDLAYLIKMQILNAARINDDD
jgi:hypothetical protein